MGVQCKGVTLIELLLSVTLAATLLMFSLLGLDSLHKKNQLQLMVNAVKDAINTAKLEALLLNKPLILAPLQDFNDWSHGWVLFVDNKTHHLKPGEKKLHEWRWEPNNIRMIWHGFQSTHYLLFKPDVGHNASNGYFIIMNATQQARLIVNRLGRVKQDY